MTQPVEDHTEVMRELDEAFAAELGFTPEYEARLLDILRCGWSRGPQTIPFDPNRWSWELKRCHLEMCFIYQTEDRLRRAHKAAALAPKARHSVQQLIGALSPADAERLRSTAEQILRTIDQEQSAMARNQPPRKRGGQTDSSPIPLALYLLWDYYFAATGDRPTKYRDQPFVAFAAAILEVPAATIFRHLKRLLNLLPHRSDLSGPANRVRGPVGLKALFIYGR